MAREMYCLPCGEEGKPVIAVVMIDGDPYCSPCARMLGQQAPAAEPTPEKTVKTTPACPRGCGAPTHRGKCKGAAKTGGKKAEPRLKLPEPVPVETLATTVYDLDKIPPIGMRMEQRVTVHEPGDLLINPEAETLDEATRVLVTEREVSIEEAKEMFPLPAVPDETVNETYSDFVKEQEATAGDVKYRRVSFDDIPVLLVARKPQGRVVTLWEQLCACTKEEPVLRVTCESIKRAGSIAHNLRTKAKTQGKKIDYRRDGAVLYVWLEEMEKTA